MRKVTRFDWVGGGAGGLILDVEVIEAGGGEEGFMWMWSGGGTRTLCFARGGGGCRGPR